MYIPNLERVENVRMANVKQTKVTQPYANSLGYSSSLRLLTIVTLKSPGTNSELSRGDTVEVKNERDDRQFSASKDKIARLCCVFFSESST